MIKRMQAARERMLAVFAGNATLEPVVVKSPFMDQEQDVPGND